MPSSENYKRDYKKETEWEKGRYHRVHAKLDLAAGEALQRILKHRDIAFMTWIREKIKADDPAPPETPPPPPRKYQRRNTADSAAQPEAPDE